jgi:hypothetical protein
MSNIEEKEVIRCFEAISEFKLAPEITARDLERVRQKLTEQGAGQRTGRQDIWRTIMRSPITKLAAAAAIIIAVVAVVHQFGGSVDMASVAWAAVSERILEADTAIFDVRVGEEEQDVPTIQCIQGKEGLRQKLPEGIDIIIDYEEGKLLILDSNRKTAMFVEMGGLPEAPPNFFERVKWGVERLKNSPDASVESLGTEEIDGRNAVGIRVYIGQSIDMRLWSDPETNLPLRIVIEKMFGQTRAVFSNFDFDAVIDESLFSMEVPEGYTQQEQAQIDLANTTEEDLIRGLGIWADLTDGLFPPKLDMGIIQEQGPIIDKKFKERQVADAEQVKMMMVIVRGLKFVQEIKGDWHYAGRGIKFGDADTAIFWYRPKDSETYRVIYGDLGVEDVAPENLPK